MNIAQRHDICLLRSPKKNERKLEIASLSAQEKRL
jgi:hypothetical protein